MKGALVHVMPPSAPPGRRVRGALRTLLFGAGVGTVLLVGTGLLGIDAMSASGGRSPSGWRVIAPSANKLSVPDAIPVGQEAELPLYACRATINRDMHVGRVRPDFAGCHIGFDGKEADIPAYETLAATWRAGADAVQGALVAGSERVTGPDGADRVARLYLCRAQNQGAVHPGQIRAGETECSFGFGGHRAASATFEVLQAEAWLQWTSATARNLPDTAIVAGSEGGESFFACRAADQGGLHPGKIKRNGPGCSVASNGREVVVERFEVLVSRWLSGHNGTVPISAVPVGWESNTLQYACRARTRDSVQVGKVSDALGGCHVGMLGREIVLPDYEVLSQ